ncbi:hypothetical protein RD110_10830 [Rhodoferax koreense]|uniref:Uncharacterized protein n=1 Tax=Rhodoferax koreensis TaxID=1842727 RepID=A0A1P8JVB5_9BURK|nr:hypothetical protein [Rhodoferax koreense]APW37621.1 hypothetical protein RD110_10830 [Rhodoferax koreense]
MNAVTTDMHTAFIEATQSGMYWPVDWAPLTQMPIGRGPMLPVSAKRYQLTHEIMEEALSYGEGPSMAEVMGLIAERARQGDKEFEELIDRMAAVFAKFNETPEEE